MSRLCSSGPGGSAAIARLINTFYDLRAMTLGFPRTPSPK